MPAPISVVVPALAIVLVVGLMLGATGGLSLAEDLGHTDEEVCAVLAQDGPAAVERLIESGFPHASLASSEVYALDQDGVREAILRVDWDAGTATCLPLDSRVEPTAVIEMKPSAYRALVGELALVLETGELSGSWNYLGIILGSKISIPDNEAYESKYRREVAKWATGWLVRGGA